MKCYGTTKQVAKKLVKEFYNDNFTRQAHSIATQAVSIILFAFHLRGYRKQRLIKLLNDIKRIEQLMDSGVFSRQFNADDCTKFLLDKYGIDVAAELQIDVDYIKEGETNE